MRVDYNGIHSLDIKVDDRWYNTWMDLHLVPTSRPYIAPPKPKTNLTMLPGTNTLVDLTDVTPGGLTFEMINGTWDFYIDHNKYSSWESSYTRLLRLFNGKTVKLKHNGSVNAYAGRLSVKGYKAGNDYSTVSIEYNLSPEIIPDISATEEGIIILQNKHISRSYSSLANNRLTITPDEGYGGFDEVTLIVHDRPVKDTSSSTVVLKTTNRSKLMDKTQTVQQYNLANNRITITPDYLHDGFENVTLIVHPSNAGT